MSHSDDTGRSRREVLGALGAGTAAALAGCSGLTGDGGGAIPEDEPLVTHERAGRGETELTWWTSAFYSPDTEQSQQPSAAPALNTQYTNWAEAHPDYRVSFSYRSSLDQWRTNLLQRAAQGNAPDGSVIDSFWVADFYEYLQPLNDNIDGVDDFFPFVQDTIRQDGDLLATWKYTGCRCLYYRQDVMDRFNDGDPPETWEDVLTVGEDIAANTDLAPFIYRPATTENLSYVFGQGAELVDDEGAPVIGEPANRQAFIETFRFLRETIDRGVSPSRVLNFDGVEALAREGRNDQAAMFIGNHDQIFRNFQNVVEGDSWRRWQVAEIPMPEPDQAATVVGGFTEGVFTDEEGRSEAVRDFAARSARPEAMGRYCEATGLLPTRQSVYDDVAYFSQNEYQQQYREFLEDGVARPPYPIYVTIDSEFESALERVLSGQASPEAAADTMIANVEEEYETNQ